MLLLRKVVAVEHPFVCSLTCWEDIAATLQKELPAKFSKDTAQTLREHATNLMEAFLYADTRQHKQSGTEEEFEEKQLFLDSLREKFSERSCASKLLLKPGRKKRKTRRVKKLLQDALETLKLKRTRQGEHGP